MNWKARTPAKNFFVTKIDMYKKAMMMMMCNIVTCFADHVMTTKELLDFFNIVINISYKMTKLFSDTITLHWSVKIIKKISRKKFCNTIPQIKTVLCKQRTKNLCTLLSKLYYLFSVHKLKSFRDKYEHLTFCAIIDFVQTKANIIAKTVRHLHRNFVK